MTPANDNKLHAVLSGDGSNVRARMSYAPHEREAIHIEKARLAKRARIGADWDGVAVNDNIQWPLAKALLAEGNTELLKYAMSYRKLYEQAKSEAVLGGRSVNFDDGMSVVRYSYMRADGTTSYQRVKQVKGADTGDMPATRKTPTDSENGIENAMASRPAADSSVKGNVASVPKPWNGDQGVNDMIDAQGKLSRLQSALGHLCEPFELACIDGRTLQEVGNSVGTANRAGAMGAGRAIVHMALATLRDIVGNVRREDLAA